MTFIQRRAALCLMVFITGCSANWQPVQLARPQTLDERTVLQFHVMMGKKDSLVRLHAVRLTKDSVSGIYWLDHTTCDTCRTGYALMDVTHAQVGSPGRGAWPIVLPFVALGATTLLVLFVCAVRTEGCHID